MTSVIDPTNVNIGQPVVLADVVTGMDDIQTVSSMPTGFHPLDEALAGGLQTRDLTLIGGVPGVGKTVFTLQMARNLARAGYQVVYVCYEHDEASLAGRLMALEMGFAEGVSASASADAQEILHEILLGQRSLNQEYGENSLVQYAVGEMARYGHNLRLVRASSIDTGIEDIRSFAEDLGSGSVVFVDYLQKMPINGDWSDDERSIRQAESLKELALTNDISVVAIAAAEQVGLQARRLRPYHLRGAGGLAYEADRVMMLNEKHLAVSKRHTSDSLSYESYRRMMVLSIEKNRHGQSGFDIEFIKDLPHFRFDPYGKFIEEKLIDDLFYKD